MRVTPPHRRGSSCNNAGVGRLGHVNGDLASVTADAADVGSVDDGGAGAWTGATGSR